MKHRLGFLVLALTLVILPACAAEPAGAAEPELTTDEQKTLYTLGALIGRNLEPFALTEADLELVKLGLADSVMGRDKKVDLAVFQPKIEELAQSRAAAGAKIEEAASADFLSAAEKEPGAVKLPSGLIYREITAGTGDSPTASDVVRVHYHGTLRDGTVFDSSVERGQPIEFPLQRVIPCWTEGVQKMKVGGKSRLVCPAAIAYGDKGAPPHIKPGATLSFEVELLDIVQAQTAMP